MIQARAIFFEMQHDPWFEIKAGSADLTSSYLSEMKNATWAVIRAWSAL